MITSDVIYGILEIAQDLFSNDCIILPKLVEKFQDDIIFHNMDFSCMTLSAPAADSDIALVLVYTKDNNIETFHMVTDCDLFQEELVKWRNHCRAKFPESKFLHHELLEGESRLSGFLNRQKDLSMKLKTMFSLAS